VQGAAALWKTLAARAENVSRFERPAFDLTRIVAIFCRKDAAMEFIEC
jgi:hypothetical protein